MDTDENQYTLTEHDAQTGVTTTRQMTEEEIAALPKPNIGFPS